MPEPRKRRVSAPVAKANFRRELRDFFGFILHPRFAPRLPGRLADSGWRSDWFSGAPLGRLLKWAAFLWSINLVVLGPIAVAAAGAGGATHRLDIYNMPWLQALIWAPIVEELVFRYSLRRLTQAWWLAPMAVGAMILGPKWPGILLAGAAVALCWLPMLAGGTPGQRPLPWRWRLRYRRLFPWVFHAACLTFAAVHLYNFNLHHTPLWLLPLLVLPQWLTGMVLAWLRMKRGIGASMLLHGLFNGGPLLVVWLVLRTVPDVLS